MQRLVGEELALVKPLLQGPRINTEVKSIVLGASPGYVWVDDGQQPETALLYSQGQSGFYVVGRERKRWIAQALAQAVAHLPKGIVTYIELSSHSDAWDRLLRDELGVLGAEEWLQWVYRQEPHDCSGPAQAPDVQSSESQICAVTPAWLKETSADTQWLQSILRSWWSSLDRFWQWGTGYAAVVDGEAVSCCYTSFVAHGGHWALGVDTKEEYRRRGLAGAVTRAMVDHCCQRGITMDWDCMDSNVPSKRLAEGCGFLPAFTYTVFTLDHVPKSS